ncbi:hypothetical protein KAH27_01020 [bacterium]|nr:hypothetical protein [bacterium]
MKRNFNCIFIVLLLFCFIAGTVHAKKLKKRKMAGQYTFIAGSLFNGTAVLAKNNATTKLPGKPNAHSVVGKWKLKRHKQFVTMDWPDMAHFDGFVVDIDTITGRYIDVDSNVAIGTLNRITNDMPLFHMHITRTRTKRAKGVTFFNYGSQIKKSFYRVIAYSRMSGDVASIVYSGTSAKTRVSKLGFFHRNIKKYYDYVEFYLISKDFNPPEESTVFPALAIDQTNVFAFDWQEPDFRWFDWAVTNYY